MFASLGMPFGIISSASQDSPVTNESVTHPFEFILFQVYKGSTWTTLIKEAL